MRGGTACTLTIPASPTPWLQPELLTHQHCAAADRALVHCQGAGRLDL
jgi:hypothetical protein